jgi:hypothetical protein
VEVLGVFIFINTPCGRALPPDNSARLQMKAGCIIIFWILLYFIFPYFLVSVELVFYQLHL